MGDRPLVSFLVIAYKQERFIREAVRSALAQTYEPLEIILSDDCSPDRTFEIISEEANAYRGPHRLVISRNASNLGIVGNFNKACGMAGGELLVLQAGDDVSLPQRTESLARAWATPAPVDLVFSDASVIGEAGATLGESLFDGETPDAPLVLEEAVNRSGAWVSGCTVAYSKSLFDKYGPIGSLVIHEDNVTPFWALLERGIRYLAEPLVKYRVHGGNIYAGTRRAAGESLSRLERQRWAVNSAAVAQE